MINWQILAAMLLPNVGGWASTVSMKGQVTRPGGKSWYQLLNKPAWTPPNWMFAPIWIVLYTTMGCASYIVYKDLIGLSDESVIPLSLYGGQLLLNWSWTPVFFGLHTLGLALAVMSALDAAAVACTVYFYNTTPVAGHLMLPYLGWLAFATCLNYSIWRRNRL